MIKVLMDLALGERVVIVCAALLLAVAGLYSFRELDIEAYPDPVQPRVEIITQPSRLSAEEVEKIATIPLEVGLAGRPHSPAGAPQFFLLLLDTKPYLLSQQAYLLRHPLSLH